MGLGIASEPYLSLPLTIDSDKLGEAVLAALTHSGRVVPHPVSAKGLAAPRLSAAGVKSERAFQTGTRSLSIERTKKSFRIEPSRNGGSKGDAKGFHPLPELSTFLDCDSDATIIGRAVRACFGRCA